MLPTSSIAFYAQPHPRSSLTEIPAAGDHKGLPLQPINYHMDMGATTAMPQMSSACWHLRCCLLCPIVLIIYRNMATWIGNSRLKRTRQNSMPMRATLGSPPPGDQGGRPYSFQGV